MSAATEKAMAVLQAALVEEEAAEAERVDLQTLVKRNLERRRAAEDAVSFAHTALEKIARSHA